MQFDILSVIARDDPAPLESAMCRHPWQMTAISNPWSGRMLTMRREDHSIKVWHRPDGLVEIEIDEVLIDASADTRVGRFVRSLLPASAFMVRRSA
jgi:hypothetical protein